eukprot:8541569-Pyramimonas_sp.AAC.1
MTNSQPSTAGRHAHGAACSRGQLEAHFHALLRFLQQYDWLYDCHMTDFFNGRLWERLDPTWIEALRKTPMEKLKLIPGGWMAPDYPPTLKVLPRNDVAFNCALRSI